MNANQPIYDAKVNKIIAMLKAKTRDEVAYELNYKSYKSLDIYMRRKNFIYDRKVRQYVPDPRKAGQADRKPENYAPAKVIGIITAFKEDGADPLTVAKQAGFKNHKEMAKYMANQGYGWDVHKNNYIKAVTKKKETPGAAEEPADAPAKATEQAPESIAEYIPFIRYLYEKRDDIYQLLAEIKEDSKIPRYTIPGLARTKTIYMSDLIAKLTAEFSKAKDITQREITEAALVEYLQKYGFKREVEALLQDDGNR